MLVLCLLLMKTKQSDIIILNRIETPDGTQLSSYHRHDFVTHIDDNGELYMVDGGTDYLRRNLNKIPYKELTVYGDSPFELVRESFRWGSYGKNGDEELHYIILKDMEESHIEAILETQPITEFIKKMLITELKYRDSKQND